jgi:hypothetical protein
MIMNLVLYAGAAAARHGLYDLDLFAGTGVLDKILSGLLHTLTTLTTLKRKAWPFALSPFFGNTLLQGQLVMCLAALDGLQAGRDHIGVRCAVSESRAGRIYG